MNDLTGQLERCVLYWRQCLVDSVEFEIKTDTILDKIQKDEDHFSLSQATVSKFFTAYKDKKFPKKKSSKAFKEDEDELSSVPVLYAPIVLRHVDFQRRGTDIIPLWIRGRLDKDGKLTITPDSFPAFNDKFIEPCRNSVFSFGVYQQKIEEALGHVGSIPENITQKDLEEYLVKLLHEHLDVEFVVSDHNGTCVQTEDVYYVLDLQTGGASAALLDLYSDIDASETVPLLIEATLSSAQTKILSANTVLEKSHTGHVTGDYPLNDAQRLALYADLQMDDGDILAVTGPPGTGKTTLIGNIIASEWVNAALEKQGAPIVLVTSTNNQAVQNALNSISGDDDLPKNHPFAQDENKVILFDRWVQGVQSFGTLLPSDREAGNRDIYENFQCMQRSYESGKSWKGWLDDLEVPDEREGRQQHYIACANKAFVGQNIATLSDAIECVHAELILAKAYLDKAIDLKVKTEAFNIEYDGCDVEAFLNEKVDVLKEQQQKLEEQNDAARVEVDTQESNLTEYQGHAHEALRLSQNKDIFEALGALFSKNMRQRRSTRVIEFLSSHKISNDDWGFTTTLSEYDIRGHLSLIENKKKEALQSAKNAFEKQKEQLLALEKALLQWEEKQSDYRALRTAWAGVLNDLQADDSRLTSVLRDPKSFEKEIDTSLRLLTFQLAARYWEGEWLQEFETLYEDEPKKLYGYTKERVEAFLRRLSKLTPCLASTAYTAPKMFRYFDTGIKDSAENSNPPLFDTIDLLIMDEAGQVAPEKGIAPLSLAKKALIVGDTDQIEPIFEHNRYEDGQLLRKHGLSRYLDDMEYRGALSHSGNMMALAKKVSVLSLDEQTQGMFLSEHRRCLPEIIAYCNELVYEGRIIPKTIPEVDPEFPAMGYAHIPGESKHRNGQSRYNEAEATTIAKWVSDNADRLMQTYGGNGKSLKDIVGIVTPFAAQKNCITEALNNHNVDSDIRVGTVHTFQGAERDLMIFSPVYGGNDDATSYFFDMKPNMLNVAVSRAKKSFLVFGDMRTLSRQPVSRPSGLLGKYLFAHQENEIHDIEIATRLSKSRVTVDVEVVDTLERHRDALREALRQSKQRLLIESAYLSINAIERDDILSLLKRASERGVECLIVYDIACNQDKSVAERALSAFQKEGIEIIGVKGTHCKTLAYDDVFYMNGSFNWLSAPRDEASKYHNRERSTLSRGSKLKSIIDEVWSETDKLAAV
ncbi:MAG: AAA domain-containing protein [Alphaproteobacteria bacterium]